MTGKCQYITFMAHPLTSAAHQVRSVAVFNTSAQLSPRQGAQLQDEQGQPARAPVTVIRSTVATWPPVRATMVRTDPVEATKETFECQGEATAPAGRQQNVPTAEGELEIRTSRAVFSSTRLIRPPTVTGDVTAVPYSGVLPRQSRPAGRKEPGRGGL
jgi:hypothetical protein